MDDTIANTPAVEKNAAKAKKSAKAAPSRTAGRPRQDDVEERTQQLMRIAIQLFLEHGYAKVSLETIAKAARVAVRTIYVKFGGKLGLLREIIVAERQRFFGDIAEMEHDPRPMPEALTDFARRFIDVALCARSARFQRIIIAESKDSPELADIFFQAGPALTRETLRRYFSRPDIRTQLRSDLPIEIITNHFINCLTGDHLMRLTMSNIEDFTADQRDERAAIGVSLFLSGVTQAQAN